MGVAGSAARTRRHGRGQNSAAAHQRGVRRRASDRYRQAETRRGSAAIAIPRLAERLPACSASRRQRRIPDLRAAELVMICRAGKVCCAGARVNRFRRSAGAHAPFAPATCDHDRVRIKMFWAPPKLRFVNDLSMISSLTSLTFCKRSVSAAET